MNTYYAKIKEILIESGFLIKKINDYWTLLYSDNTTILEHRRLGELLVQAEKELLN